MTGVSKTSLVVFVVLARFLVFTAKFWQVNDHRNRKELIMNQSKTTLLRSRNLKGLVFISPDRRTYSFGSFLFLSVGLTRNLQATCSWHLPWPGLGLRNLGEVRLEPDPDNDVIGSSDMSVKSTISSSGWSGVWRLASPEPNRQNSNREKGFGAQNRSSKSRISPEMFHRTLKSQCGMALPCLVNGIAQFMGSTMAIADCRHSSIPVH